MQASSFSIVFKFLLCLLLTSLIACNSTEVDQNESSEGYSKIARIDKAMEQEFYMTKDPVTNEVPREKLLLAHKMYQQTARLRNTQMAWEERGPSNVGGRTRAILIDANDVTGNTVWAGGAGGGLWKSTAIRSANAGWSPVNDLFENIAISAIAQDPNNPDNIYFGTGEGWFNADAIRGLGIWKSTDGGITWNALPSTAGSGFNYIQKIVINSSGTVFASTRNAGIQRSTDGGATWTQVLGSGNTATTNRGADLAMATTGVIFASMGVFNQDGIYKSSNNGNTWSKLSIGLPSSGYERIELAMAPSNNNRIYALFQNGSNNQCLGIYRTDNGGASWTEVDNPSAFGMTSFTRNQAWYDLIAEVDPNNEDRLFIGGVDLLVSNNGGASWTQVSQWFGGGGFPYVHADQHEIVFFPGSSTEILFGNDGGVYYTDNGNASNPGFDSKNDGYNVTQFYDCAIHPGTGVNGYLAGAQDNGTQEFNSPGIDETVRVTGGDGAFCHIDQDQPNIQISSYVYNSYWITNNSWASDISRDIGNDVGRFINPTDYDNGNNILYGAGDDGEYTRISAVGTSNITAQVSVAAFGSGAVSTVLVPEITDHRVYFGLDNGNLVRVDNANTNNPLATVIGNINASRFLSGIDIVDGNEDHLLISYSNYATTSIFETTDGGSSWTAVEGNLPDMPVRDIMFSPNDNNKALAATETGVWFTEALNGDNTVWTPCTNGMPNTRANKLEVRSSDNQLIVATHGRGLFSTDFFSSPSVNFVNDNFAYLEEDANAMTDACRNYKDELIAIKFRPLPPAATTINVTIDAANTTATEFKDFELLTDNLIFGPATADVQEITVRIYDDKALETGPEMIVLELDGGTFTGSLVTSTIAISDLDFDPVRDGSTNIDIGDGLGSFDEGVFDGFYEDNKTQITYSSSELTAAGLLPGDITALSFEIVDKNSTAPYENFSVGIKNGSFATGDFTGGFTNVFNGTITTEIGWYQLGFNSSFFWNGVDDLIIETCFDNSAWTTSDVISATTMSESFTKYRRADGEVGCSFTSGAQETNIRPNIRFNQNVSTPIASAVTPSVNDFIQVGDMYYLYNDNNELLIGLEQLDGSDLSCVEVSVSRSGEGIQYPMAFSPAGISDKVVTVNAPSNVNYNITLFYTAAELALWADDPMTLNILKTSGAISDATPANSVVGENVDLTITNFNDIYAFTGSFTGFSSFAITNFIPSALPVDLTVFNGARTGKTNTLKWVTESETNNRGFAVERSFDGNLFSEIGFVSGAGDSEQTLNYQWLDRDLQKSGNYYYRLKQLDFDGVISYSETIVLKVEADGATIIVAPNPASNYLNISWTTESTKERHLTLFHPNGKLIAAIGSLDATTGTINVDLTSYQLSNGVYYIRLMEGEQIIQMEKVVVIK